MAKKVCFINLGCKVNKYENDCMENICLGAGYLVVGKKENPDYFVINTCAVTNESEKKGRQYVSKLASLAPNAKFVVVGCASEHNPEQFWSKDNIIAVSGTSGKSHILDMLVGKKVESDTTKYEDLKDPYVTHTRAYLKVQDGCNNFCNYCIIPYLRGRSRSRKFDDAVLEACKLSKSHKEIVVTGIDLSSYRDGNYDLGDLIYAMRGLDSRIRIGSLEVGVVDTKLLDKLSSTPNFCPHFHLSLQSGSDTVLKRMNRHYSSKDYLNRVRLIRKYFPDCNITTDVIVGFSGETEKEFRDTIRLCKKAKFGYIHIFPYSKKSGTVADKFPDLDKATKHSRVKELEKVRDKLEYKYNKSRLKKVYDVLFEEYESGYTYGYTPNYIRVRIPGKYTGINKVKLLKINGNIVEGEIYDK